MILTVHFGSFLGDDPLAWLQQGLAVRHVGLGARRGEGRGGGGRQLLQLEEVQAHVGAAEEPAASQAAAAVPAALVADSGFLRPEEPQPEGTRKFSQDGNQLEQSEGEATISFLFF